MGKRAEAIDHFILASKKDPTDEKAHLYWGLTLAMDKKFEDAISHYRIVLEINPEHSNAYAYWGTSLSALGKLKEAVSKLEESLMLNRFNSQAYEILIDVLYQRQKYKRAWEMVHKARADNISLQQSFTRSEEHTSELQSQAYLVCRLLLEKKNHPHHPPPLHTNARTTPHLQHSVTH